MNVIATVPAAESRAAPHSSRIEAVGLALPERRLSTAALMASRRHRFPLDLEGRSGIRERRECADGEDTVTLAVAAARDALRYSRYEAPELEMIVNASITRHRGGLALGFEPPLSLSVKEALGAPDALNFDLSNACAGMLTGVAVLDTFIRSGTIRRGMVVSGEYITGLAHNAARTVRSVMGRQIASLTLGDAGSAVIVERAPEGGAGILASEIVTFAQYSGLCVGKPSDDAPGCEMDTHTSGLHRAAIANSPAALKRALEHTGLTPDDFTYLIPHQTAVPAIKAGIKHVERRFGPWAGSVIYNVEELGNTASTTHFAALYRMLQEGRLRADDRIMMLCTASGLTVGAMAIAVGDLWERYGRAA